MASCLKALVTGATGFIGGHLTRLLVSQGVHVRALVRQDSVTHFLKGLDIEFVFGDLRDKASLVRACQGCDHLYHAAAAYDFWLPNKRDFYDINVGGTKNILEAARRASLSKIVYTSTVGTLRYPDDPNFPSDETCLPVEKDLSNDYKKSKFQAEQVALQFAKDGLPIIIVLPSAPIGAYDVKPTPTGQMIVNFLKGKVPAYLQTGLNLIDVEDVAWGYLLAAQKGEIGARYILGNQNMSLKEIYETLAKISGRKSPRVCIPYAMALSVAYGTEFFGKVFHRRPSIPVGAVRMAKKYMYFTSNKAIKELSLPQSPIHGAFEKAVSWFQTNGYVE